MNNILADRIIERLEATLHSLDAAFLLEPPTSDEFQDLSDDAADTLHATYLLTLREDRLRLENSHE
jgi:hypothetical protein